MILCLVAQISRNRGKNMQKTENYGFNIPEEHEFFDAELENENWSKLDAALKEISDKLDAQQQ